FSTVAHPGGANYWTFFTLVDHLAHDGGPLPRPDKARVSVSAGYNDFRPNGSSRAFIAWQGWWDGVSQAIEIDFYTSPDWGDADADKDIIATGYPLVPPPGYDSYIVMDGMQITSGAVT